MSTEINESMIFLNEYSKSTKIVCSCVAVSIMLILLFILSPLKDFLLVSFFGKTATIVVLAYALYTNITVTNVFATNIKLFEGDWNNIKTNIICSYIFSLFIVFLLYSVIKKFY